MHFASSLLPFGLYISFAVAFAPSVERDEDPGFLSPAQGGGSQINQSGGEDLGEPLNVGNPVLGFLITVFC